jgi:hemerythrin-like domain-containing protein
MSIQTATPTDILRHEHKVILMVLAAARREADSIGRTGKVDAGRVGKMVEFFRNFADRCHHGKEETLLFAKMEQRGVPREGGPIGMMLMEHDAGRQHVRALAAALPGAERGDRTAATAVREHLLAYADLLEQHIEKEDDCLYPMADNVLTTADQQELAAGFARVETEEMGEG